MKVNYNVTGKERKRLAQTIGKAIGVDAIYKGVPTCAYEIDYFTIDREGALIFDDVQDSQEVELVFDAIAAAGFEPQDSGDNERGIAIQMPMMSGDEISLLEALIESKESLIRKAIGTDSLMVSEKDGKLDFPWFPADSSPEEIKAYMDFVTALCREIARNNINLSEYIHTCTGRNKLTDNNIFLKTDKRVALAFDSRIGKDSCCFLEGSG